MAIKVLNLLLHTRCRAMQREEGGCTATVLCTAWKIYFILFTVKKLVETHDFFMLAR